MRCTRCDQEAVFSQPTLCKGHFIDHFETKVRRTIEEHDLIRPGDRIAVAVSGGKDSLAVLTLLKREYGDVTAISIDEGIAGYREHTLADARRVCEQHDIPLVIRSYEELTGMTLDGMLKARPMHPCTVCGALRRHLLLVASRGFDVLATGHNADDEAQAVLMNIIKGNTSIFPRIGPVSGHGAEGFVRRVKPLYFCSEKEVMTYAYLKGLTTAFSECPNIDESYRHIIRDSLNAYAQSHPGVRERLLRSFLLAKQAYPAQPVTLQRCEACGEPASAQLCKACSYIASLPRPA